MYSGEFKPKNSTTARKGSNDMKANASLMGKDNMSKMEKMRKMEAMETPKMEMKESKSMEAKEARMGIEMKHADGKRHEDHHPAVKMAKGK
jgi:hypothetical protein